jgi:hypothetical protein
MSKAESKLRKATEAAINEPQPYAFWGEEREAGFDQLVVAKASADCGILSTLCATNAESIAIHRAFAAKGGERS